MCRVICLNLRLATCCSNDMERRRPAWMRRFLAKSRLPQINMSKQLWDNFTVPDISYFVRSLTLWT
jgi:hypothetical protein